VCNGRPDAVSGQERRQVFSEGFRGRFCCPSSRRSEQMSLLKEPDYGTPASPRAEMVSVEIDGMPATVRAGTTVLRAARETGVDVPKLCATDSLKPFGSCRLCLVEIEGRKGRSEERRVGKGCRSRGTECR